MLERDVIDVATRLTPETAFAPVSMAELLAASAEACGVSEAAVRAPIRSPGLVQARRLMAYLCRTHTHNSYPAIARFMGRKDHTTVLHNYRVATEKMASELAFAEMARSVERRLGL